MHWLPVCEDQRSGNNEMYMWYMYARASRKVYNCTYWKMWWYTVDFNEINADIERPNTIFICMCVISVSTTMTSLMTVRNENVKWHKQGWHVLRIRPVNRRRNQTNWSDDININNVFVLACSLQLCQLSIDSSPFELNLFVTMFCCPNLVNRSHGCITYSVQYCIGSQNLIILNSYCIQCIAVE